MKYVLLLILLSGCMSIKRLDPRTYRGIDPEFIEYVEEFEDYYGKSIGDVSMGFADLKDPSVGVCVRWISGHREIKIDREYWTRLDVSKTDKIGLMFHELGHCVLNRDHTDEEMQVPYGPYTMTVPKSLMYPTLFYSKMIANELQQHYYDELFNPKKYNTINNKPKNSSCVEDVIEF